MKRGVRVAIGCAAALVLAGCTTPAQVEAQHVQENADYANDIDFAQRWAAHGIFGLPVEGVMWLSIMTLLVGAALLITLGAAIYRHVREGAQERNRVELARVQRGRCKVCGADPLEDAPAQV